MTTNDIAAIRKLTDAATPGPWRADDSEIYTDNLELVAEGNDWVGEALQDDDDATTRANTAFVAAARTLVPALCDEIEQLRAKLATMTEVAQSNKRHVTYLTEVIEQVDQVVKKYDAINGAYAPLAELRPALNGRAGQVVAR